MDKLHDLTMMYLDKTFNFNEEYPKALAEAYKDTYEELASKFKSMKNPDSMRVLK
jgi:hypothetical protein